MMDNRLTLKQKNEADRRTLIKKILDLKFLILPLGLRIEGLEKCFKNAGKDDNRREKCLRSLSNLKEHYLTINIDDMKKIKDEIIDKVSGELKVSLNLFFEKFESKDLSENKLSEAKDSLCKILIAIEKELK